VLCIGELFSYQVASDDMWTFTHCCQPIYQLMLKLVMVSTDILVGDELGIMSIIRHCSSRGYSTLIILFMAAVYETLKKGDRGNLRVDCGIILR
jgi:hypothetical protein